MTESDCKLITEKLLGEKWHEVVSAKDKTGSTFYVCISCKSATYLEEESHTARNRTFTTPQDFFACFEKLVELGKWEEFYTFAWSKKPTSLASFMQWLLSRTESGHYRLCQLTAEYLKVKEKNNG
jgi:hypothetical protein